MDFLVHHSGDNRSWVVGIVVARWEFPSDVQAALEVGKVFVEAIGLHAVFDP